METRDFFASGAAFREVSARDVFCRDASAVVANRGMNISDLQARLEAVVRKFGAESGTVPVSAVAPAMLVSEMETQRQPQGTARPPILPIPGADAARQ